MNNDTCCEDFVKKLTKKRPSKKQRQKLRRNQASTRVQPCKVSTAVNNACVQALDASNEANHNGKPCDAVRGTLGTPEWHEWSNGNDAPGAQTNPRNLGGIMVHLQRSFEQYKNQQRRESPEGQEILNKCLDSITFEKRTVVTERFSPFGIEWMPYPHDKRSRNAHYK